MFQLIEIRGDDAATFLQGQLTQDVRKLTGSGTLLAAWCDPKGRVICVTRMLALDGSFGLLVPAELADTVARRLLMYRLRARVDIELAEDWRAAAVAADDDLEILAKRDLLPDAATGASRRADGITGVELGGRNRCVELYGRRKAFDDLALASPLTEADWRKALIEAGLPTVTAATSGQYTPHMLNLDLLGAVSFDKGCYTGQEIVARTQHRGRSKRRLMHYCLEKGEAAVGDRLAHAGREVGEVINTAGRHLLAVTPVDMHEQPLTLNGHQASPVPLPYAVPRG